MPLSIILCHKRGWNLRGWIRSGIQMAARRADGPQQAAGLGHFRILTAPHPTLGSELGHRPHKIYQRVGELARETASDEDLPQTNERNILDTTFPPLLTAFKSMLSPA